MSVRVNKASFSIREKLSELERPIGLKGSELMRSETAQEARDFISAGRKNMIINGACMINQRFDSGTYTLTASPDYFPVDRFRSWAYGGGQFTIQRSDNAPPGFKNSMMYTVSTADASIGSNDYYVVQQRIEGYNFAHLGWGTANAKPVTLSFWVKGDIPGKYGISFWPDGQNYNYVTSYTINNADTWEYKTITIPGATAGTWITDTGTGLGIWWDFGTGTTYQTSTTETWGQSTKFIPSNSAQMIATNSAKFRMTGVQLEVGKNATDFEHRSYGEELALCQRYFYKLDTMTGLVIHAQSAKRALTSIWYPVTMRTTPGINSPSTDRYALPGESNISNTIVIDNTYRNAKTTTIRWDNGAAGNIFTAGLSYITFPDSINVPPEFDAEL